MLGIKSIIYQKNNEYFIINVGNECNILYKGISKKIDNKLIFNYLESLFAIINGWQKQYINTRMIDGQDWKLSINLIDSNKKEYYGHSEFPINFEAFERLNQKIIDEVI